jgi:hypothetical protein
MPRAVQVAYTWATILLLRQIVRASGLDPSELTWQFGTPGIPACLSADTFFPLPSMQRKEKRTAAGEFPRLHALAVEVSALTSPALRGSANNRSEHAINSRCAMLKCAHL